MNKIITLIAILTSFSVFADSGDTCVSCKDKHDVGDVMDSAQMDFAKNIPAKAKVKLSRDENDIICDQMVNDFYGTKSRVEMLTKLPFAEGYKYVSCPIPGERSYGWGLIGKAFRRPPSSSPIIAMKKMFRFLKKTDPQVIKYIYTHKDSKGHGIYDYLRLAEERYSKPKDKFKSYYKYMKKHVESFDPNKK